MASLRETLTHRKHVLREALRSAARVFDKIADGDERLGPDARSDIAAAFKLVKASAEEVRKAQAVVDAGV